MGRPKGSENKRQFNAEELAREMGVDPLRFLLRVANGDEPMYDKDRVRAAGMACKYLYAEKQSIAHSTGEEGFKVIIEDYRQDE